MSDQINMNIETINRIIKLEIYIASYKKMCEFHESELKLNYDAILESEKELLKLQGVDC